MIDFLNSLIHNPFYYAGVGILLFISIWVVMYIRYPHRLIEGGDIGAIFVAGLYCSIMWIISLPIFVIILISIKLSKFIQRISKNRVEALKQMVENRVDVLNTRKTNQFPTTIEDVYMQQANEEVETILTLR